MPGIHNIVKSPVVGSADVCTHERVSGNDVSLLQLEAYCLFVQYIDAGYVAKVMSKASRKKADKGRAKAFSLYLQRIPTLRHVKVTTMTSRVGMMNGRVESFVRICA